jgi:ferredoxin
MDHHSCSGCSLCLLVCPVWRVTRDVRLTPRGRAKAQQHGADAAALAASVDGCALCGACVPACPEELPLVDMIVNLRRQETLPALAVDGSPRGKGLLLAGRTLGRDQARRLKVLELLGEGFELAADDGSDIALALETGARVPAPRLERFLDGVRSARRLVVAEGILLGPLRRWLPRASVEGLGGFLSGKDEVRSKLRPSDLYVIEPRGFHADHARLVGHYDSLRQSLGCAMNLDLQRIAIPLAGPDIEAQARWILEGREVERIVVEDLGDAAAFSFSGHPVMHLADL